MFMLENVAFKQKYLVASFQKSRGEQRNGN